MTDHGGTSQPLYRPYDGPARRLEYAYAELARTPAAGSSMDGFLVDPEKAAVAIARLDEAILDIKKSWTLSATTRSSLQHRTP